jgi:hypothetical protein
MSQDEQEPTKLYVLLAKISRVPVLVALLAFYLLFALYILPNGANEMETGPLDLKFSYSPATAYEMIEAYGEQGRARYARSAMTMDVAYPIVYTLMFIVWISLALKGTNLSPTRQCWVSMSPLSVFILDLTENAGIVAMLKTYPDQHNTLATATSLATSAKWIAAAFTITMTLIITAHWAYRKITRR